MLINKSIVKNNKIIFQKKLVLTIDQAKKYGIIKLSSK